MTAALPNPEPAWPEAPNDSKALSKRPPGPWRIAAGKFVRNPYAMVSVFVLLFFIIVAAGAPMITSHDPAKVNLMIANLPPGTDGHPLGTDELGRDILTRLIYSSRISLTVGFSVALASVIIGTIIGSLAGYFGGWVDAFLMRIVDVMYALPTLFLNILVLAIFGKDFIYMILILSFTSWMGVARLVRGTFLQLREMQYVEAARAIGVSNISIMFRHLLRNATHPIIVNATLMVGSAILSESALSFLSLGIQPPDTSWGLMLSSAQEFMLINPMLAVYPGVCILTVVLAVNFIGDGIQHAMNPREKQKISARRIMEWRTKYSK